MKAFVTGGTGFLGINLIKKLHGLGWHITAICRPNSDRLMLLDIPVDWREGYITNKADVTQAIDDDVDVIFHMAGDTNMWSVNNDTQYEVNVTATQHIVDVALSKNIGKFIHTSSISAFGFHDTVIYENTPSTALESKVNYLKTKYLGEQIVKHAVNEKGLQAVIMNPCAIMGAYDKHNWSQLFTMIDEETLPGVPSGEGSYCHVDEVVNAHIAAVTKGRVGENYILAGVDHGFLEVVNKIAYLLNKPAYKTTVPAFVLKALAGVSDWWSRLPFHTTLKEPTMTPEKALMVTKRVVATSGKAVKELGYNANVPLDVMLEDCYLWLQTRN